MKENAYKKSGVDIEAGAALVERIKPHVKSTHREGVVNDIGGFGALFDLKKTGMEDPVLVSATDGVGTKLKIAIETGIHNTVGIDLVAMCVNDLIVQGAEPLFFLDYYATGKLDNDIAEQVIYGITQGCKQAGCALIGGETAEMPGMYGKDDYDLAGFTVGAVERNKIITGDSIEEGDVILGIESSGVHSNGFSLIRRIIDSSDSLNYNETAPFSADKTLGEVFLEPTKIYVKPILSVLDAFKDQVRGLAHITGGGFIENVPRVLPDNLCAEIDVKSWSMSPLFHWLKENGALEISDMFSTFNCGIGMMVICAPSSADEIRAFLNEAGETTYEIGKIAKKTGQEGIVLLNTEDLDS